MLPPTHTGTACRRGVLLLPQSERAGMSLGLVDYVRGRRLSAKY